MFRLSSDVKARRKNVVDVGSVLMVRGRKANSAVTFHLKNGAGTANPSGPNQIQALTSGLSTWSIAWRSKGRIFST